MLVDVCEHAIAVELRLPHPLGAIERRVARFGEHRGERRGHRLELAGGSELRRGHAIDGEEFELPDRLARENRVVLRGDVDGHGEAVLVLQQKPLLLVLGAHQCERTFQLLAAQLDAQLAFLHALPDLALRPRAVVEPRRSPFVGRIDAAVPDDHFAGAVLAGWNHAFERAVVVGVILHMHGQALFVAIERRPLGHRPGEEDAVAFEPEIVVKSCGGMLLDDEQQRPAARRWHGGRRLGRGREGPLGGIFG